MIFKPLIINFLLLFFLFLSVSKSVQAISKYDLYDCTNNVGCSGQCEKKGKSVTFKVNSSKSLVIMSVYEQGELHSTATFDNCKVIDNINWDCSTQIESQSSMVYRSTKMVNAVYSNILTNFLMTTAGLTAKVIGEVCAK